jgi:DNA-binding response OmpR family regulator
MKDIKAKVLIAEDDQNLGHLLKEYMTVKGYDTDLFANGEIALKGFKNNKYDICLLDVMMPVKDGFTLAQDIRVIDTEVPIIFLTAKAMKEDVVEGFKIGADDYITKPFSMEELLFRIEAVLRRTKGAINQDQTTFPLGKYLFESNKQTLQIGNKSVKLTTKEADLLLLLCQHTNGVLDRNYALKKIWLDDTYFNARSMDVYITKLRKHLKDDESIEIINVHGKGFKLLIN